MELTSTDIERIRNVVRSVFEGDPSVARLLGKFETIATIMGIPFNYAETDYTPESNEDDYSDGKPTIALSGDDLGE